MPGSRSVILLLGSNLDEPIKQLKIARDLIGTQLAKIKKTSSIYKTAAWGNTDQPDFMNQIIEIISTRSAVKILAIIKNIEKVMGRISSIHWGPRIIDIDILFCGKEKINSKILTIPHPSIEDRLFTLIPLQELNPGFVHPVNRKTVGEMIASCNDHSAVNKVI
ncbi:MAG: 2-amino-4-hydroxy-6-hydroxymethyldihydropteridine diphosphokinase [Saprospiraceae bacterium]|nr:2-amino-4-hydroxy-6-hydroxymethyldihydropteridine diphosphokinase [Saprospiraceae bacterium]